MTLGISIPSPAAGASPASDDSSQLHTPVSPVYAELPGAASNASSSTGSSSTNGATGGSKRKSSRRANTAERRATHNAVERARRETLNGRFLDLAALLPNLSQIRRPSKSAIVNSSIAHVHASRRHRALASRELRLLKLEADALRRELNEWRDRAGIPRVQEPTRGDGFSMILSGEIEIIPIAGNLEEEDGDYAYGEEGDGNAYAGGTPPEERDTYEFSLNVPASSSLSMNPNVRQGIPQRPSSNGPMPFDMSMERHMLRRSSGPLVASPNNMAVDNPAISAMYNGIPGVTYATPFTGSELEQSKWGPGANVGDQELLASLSRRGSVGSDGRRTRNRAMSTSSSGRGSPHNMAAYYEPAWNNGMNGMAPNMGSNMGMMGGGGSMGSNGTAFAMMM